MNRFAYFPDGRLSGPRRGEVSNVLTVDVTHPFTFPLVPAHAFDSARVVMVGPAVVHVLGVAGLP